MDRGQIPCDLCNWREEWEDQKTCEQCGGQGALTVYGTPQEALGVDFQGATVAVWMVFMAREKQWTPESYLREPAKFIAAYRYCLPYILAEVEINEEQHRRNAERRSKEML